jgi:hypothetical protein
MNRFTHTLCAFNFNLRHSVEDDFTAHTVTAVICCAGNRRTEVGLCTLHQVDP